MTLNHYRVTLLLTFLVAALLLLVLLGASLFSLDTLVLHSVDHGAIYLNPSAISSMRTPPPQRGNLVHPDARCLVSTPSGNLAVLEDCESISKQLNSLH